MANVGDQGLVYGGWQPVNVDSQNPSAAFLDTGKSPTSGPIQQGVHNFGGQKWEFKSYLVDRPTETWQSYIISERQQEANILADFSPLTLTPKDIAMGSIILSLLAVAALGN